MRGTAINEDEMAGNEQRVRKEEEQTKEIKEKNRGKEVEREDRKGE